MFTKEVIMGVVRHILSSVGAAVATAGYVGEADVTAITGGIVAIVGLVWSIIDKKAKS